MINKESHVLIMGSGPSIFYNVDKVRDHIKKYNPVIIGINGYIYGLAKIRGKVFTEKLVDKPVTIDMSSVEDLMPHIIFSFLSHTEKYTPMGKYLGKVKKRDLFQDFIISHKKSIVDNKITLMCPNNRSCKYNDYGQAKWSGYDRYKEFDVWPKGYKGHKDKFRYSRMGFEKSEDLYHDRIRFKINHGGEFVLCWSNFFNPSSLAFCGVLDFPNTQSNYLKRGWFWSKIKKKMPRRMKSNQSRIINLFYQNYGDRLLDLNLEPWKL